MELPVEIKMFCACGLCFGLTDRQERYCHGLALGHGSGGAVRQSRDIRLWNGEILVMLER